MSLRVVLLLVRTYYLGTRPWEQLFSRSASRGRGVETKHTATTVRRIGYVLLSILLFFSFVMVMVMFGFNYYSFQSIGRTLGYPDIGAMMAQFIGAVIVFLFSCMSAPSVLYRGKDLSLLMSVPIRRSELLASRMVLLYLSMASLYFFIVFPGIVIVYFVTGISVPLFLGAVLTLLLGPVVPVLLGSLFGMLITRLMKGRKHKSLIEVFSIIVMMALIIYSQSSIMRFTDGSGLFEGSAADDLGRTYGALFERLHHALPLFACQASVLFSVGGRLNPYLAAAACIVMNAVLALVAMFLLEASYGRCVSIALSGEGRSRRRETAGATERFGDRSAYRPASLRSTLIRKEWDVVRGTSSFFVEIIGEVCVPIILVVVYALSGLLGELSEGLGALTVSPWFPAAVSGILLLMSSFTMISSTSVSREGPLFDLCRSWPIPASVQVDAKLVFHMLLMYLSHAVYLLVAVFLLGIGFENLPWMLALGFFTILGTGALSLAVDYRRPLLDWKIPQQAMKRNFNGLIGMGIGLLYLAVVASAVLLAYLAGLTPVASMYVGCAASAVGAFASRKIALRQGRSAYLPR